MSQLAKLIEGASPLLTALFNALLHKGVLHADDILRHIPSSQEELDAQVAFDARVKAEAQEAVAQELAAANARQLADEAAAVGGEQMPLPFDPVPPAGDPLTGAPAPLLPIEQPA